MIDFHIEGAPNSLNKIDALLMDTENSVDYIIEDSVKKVAASIDEYFYIFIEQLGGETLRGKDVNFIKSYIDTNFKGLTIIKKRYDAKIVGSDILYYYYYIVWNKKSMLILCENKTNPYASYFINNPKIEILSNL